MTGGLAWLGLGLGLGMLGVLGGLRAQTPGAGEVPGLFSVPVTEPNTGRLLAVLSGAGFKPLSLDKGFIRTVGVNYYDTGGRTNLLLQGLECIYDSRRQLAWSSNRLEVMSGDGRLRLEGRGFTWWQTNSDLAISNDVHTVLYRRASPSVAGERGQLDVFSDTFRFLYASNLIVFRGQVRIEDARWRVHCGVLMVTRTAAGAIDHLVAEDNVVAESRLDGSRTTTARATYRTAGDEEWLSLTGDPRWSDGVREGRAREFILDQRRNQLRALGGAYLRLPRQATALPGLFAPGAGTEAPPAPTDRTIEVTAGMLTLQFPPTNGPVQRVLAETNVVILDPTAGVRATARSAVYEGSGNLELQGEPEIRAGDRVLLGRVVRFDAHRQSLEVHTNVVLRMPVLSLGRPIEAWFGPVASTNRPSSPPPTNHVISIRSDDLTYQDGWLRFGPGVHAEYRDGDQLLGALRCRELALRYTNRLDELVATGDANLESAPLTDPGGLTAQRRLRAERLQVGFDPTGRAESFRAEGSVDARQEEWRGGAAPATARRLECRVLTLRFGLPGQPPERAVAEDQVRLSGQGRAAESQRAEYTGADQRLRLTGQPRVQTPEGWLEGADELIWDRRLNRYRATGKFLSRWRSLPLTNQNQLWPSR